MSCCDGELLDGGHNIKISFALFLAGACDVPSSPLHFVIGYSAGLLYECSASTMLFLVRGLKLSDSSQRK